MSSPRFVWDDKVKRYRYLSSGRFVSQTVVEKLTRDRITQVKKDLQTIGQLLIDGKINLATWEQETALALKVLHIQTYTLHKGGAANMTATDYSLIEQALREEFQYLHNFTIDIYEGRVSEAQFNARLAGYSRKSRYSAELARRELAYSSNSGYAKRFLGPTDRSCRECLYYASLGLQPIGILPLPTQKCSCRSNCLCSIRYYDSQDAEEVVLAS
jgi:hypothetical protein